ncbi:hypothetical protein B0T10DRAFT_487235 [Thelonectria olida]|uniref:Uncharacterized protein n=1 Tax=Thelonectria olida TaxID=1576542 RepID=A0A9P8W7P3_9HYPO|nr:hypothetical protein B0T10DRAFT_487235 [Thelonectria olida]
MRAPELHLHFEKYTTPRQHTLETQRFRGSHNSHFNSSCERHLPYLPCWRHEPTCGGSFKGRLVVCRPQTLLQGHRAENRRLCSRLCYAGPCVRALEPWFSFYGCLAANLLAKEQPCNKEVWRWICLLLLAEPRHRGRGLVSRRLPRPSLGLRPNVLVRAAGGNPIQVPRDSVAFSLLQATIMYNRRNYEIWVRDQVCASEASSAPLKATTTPSDD